MSDLDAALGRVQIALGEYANKVMEVTRERDEYDETIAKVRETLAQFTSEDVCVMASRAIDEIVRLRAALLEHTECSMGMHAREALRGEK